MHPAGPQRIWLPLIVRVALPSVLCVLLFSLATFVILLPAFERGLLTRKQEMIHELTQTVCSALTNWEERVQSGELSRDEAQRRALDHIRVLRYGTDLKDYFWINDLTPRMILHPHRPDLEGQELRTYADPTGKHLFVEMADVARRDGRGYVRYMWQWKDNPAQVVPKLSYVQMFEPWGWVVGTGVYLDDVAAQTRAITRRLGLVTAGILAIVALLSVFVVGQGYRAEARRWRAEVERQELKDRLFQTQKMEAVGQLAGGVAHDFNNLLTVINGGIDELRRLLPTTAAAAGSLNAIEEAADQASDVTRSLLTFSHKLPTHRKPLDLCEVVGRAVTLLKRLLPASIELTVDTSADPPPNVLADDAQMQQVVLNLAINARDAMPGGGTLQIAVARGSERDADTGASWARLTVSDSGHGIPPDVQAHMFEPFFTTKPRGQGTGLGLAIVHSVVADHGGRIEVQSQVGQGTTFVVLLPCTTPDATASVAGTEAAETPGQGEVVLLAEDYRPAREVMAAKLLSLGYEVLQASDGAALLDTYRAQRERIRLFVIDFDMPRRNGLDCLRDIRTGGDGAPAIVITGGTTAHLEDQLPANALLLRKPFQMAELGRLVAGMLRSNTREGPTS